MSQDFNEFSEKAKRMASDSAESVKEKLGAFVNAEDLAKLKEGAGEMAEEAAAFVRKYPVQSALGALAVGILLGAFLKRRE